MIQVSISKNGKLTNRASMPTREEVDAWLASHERKPNPWGHKKDRWLREDQFSGDESIESAEQTRVVGEGEDAHTEYFFSKEYSIVIEDITQDHEWSKIRAKRDRLLQETDYIMMPDYPLADKSAWQAYRDELRLLPQTYSDALQVQWPIKPE